MSQFHEDMRKRADLYRRLLNGGYDQRDAVSVMRPPTLAEQVQSLQDRAESLDHVLGELLAMLGLTVNRDRIREGNPEILDEFFRLVDQFKLRHDRIRGES